MLLEQQNKDRLLQSRQEHTDREKKRSAIAHRGPEALAEFDEQMRLLDEAKLRQATKEGLARLENTHENQDPSQSIGRPVHAGDEWLDKLREKGLNYEWANSLEDTQQMQHQRQQERLNHEMHQLEQDNLQRRLQAEAQAQPETHDEHSYSASADEFHSLPAQTEQQDTDEWRDGRGPLISSDFGKYYRHTRVLPGTANFIARFEHHP